jgi:hypothetical protein
MNSRKVLDVKIIWFDSYLQAIKNSIGSNFFRNLFAYVDGVRMDIRDDGRLSCAAFVSTILFIHKLSGDVHATVEGTLKDMAASGWQEIDKPRPGAVIIWQPLPPEDVHDDLYWQHDHIGFYIGDDMAVSHLGNQRHPAMHHWTYGEKDGQPVRKIEKIYWNNKLNEK